MRRNWSKTSEGAAARAAGRPGALPALTLTLTAVLAGLTGLAGCSGNGDGGGDRHSPSPSATKRDRGSRQPPQGSGRLGPAPSAVPSVRAWKAVRGPGWRRTQHTRVVVGTDSLRDEAQLLADELKVDMANGPAHTGDIELKRGKDGKTGKKGEPGSGPESYRLVSRDGKVTITGGDDAGVFYGTRTLLQTHRAQGRFAEGTARDAPDRPQRGFSLDIARKHFSADWIKARIREMGEVKLNQLQLHLSDDQAFRIESDTHPEIVSDPHLTKAQVRDIVRLAGSRHITVIPEIDSPGHLGAVLKAHPDLQLRSATGRTPRGAVDISKPEAAKLVDDLLAEFAGLFPSTYAHLGGDEYLALMTREPRTDLPGPREQGAGDVWERGQGPGLGDRLAQRPRRDAAQARQDPAGVERRHVPCRRRQAGQAPPGRLLDRTGSGGAPAHGVSEGGLEGRQPQRQVPVLRPGPAQQVHLPDRPPHL